MLSIDHSHQTNWLDIDVGYIEDQQTDSAQLGLAHSYLNKVLTRLGNSHTYRNNTQAWLDFTHIYLNTGLVRLD